MTSKFTMLIAFLFMATTTVLAQGMQRLTVAERVKATMEKLTPLGLNETQAASTDSVFANFYTTQAKMREDARASRNRPDRSVFQKMAEDRDAKLKAIFTPEQYTKYKDEIEATLRPQRQSRGNN